jgi:hypothetical protein
MRSYRNDLRLWEERNAANISTNLISSQVQSQASQSQSTRRRNRRGQTTLNPDPRPAPPVQPQPRMQADEVTLFLSLFTSLKLYLGRQIDEEDIDRADALLQQYLQIYCQVSTFVLTFIANIILQLYGSASMKPNHHYVVHLPDQLRDFGPVYEFWTFLTERLNKILKSYNSNFWGGGQLEVSMMRHFNREVRVHNLVSFVQFIARDTYFLFCSDSSASFASRSRRDKLFHWTPFCKRLRRPGNHRSNRFLRGCK